MKKLVVILLLSVIATGVHAQFEKHKWFINTSATGLGFSYCGDEKARFGFNAHAGTFIADNFALSVEVGGEYGKGITDMTHIGGGGRYYFNKVGIYLGLGVKYNYYGSHATEKGDVATGLEVGYAFFLSRTVTIEPAIYYDQSLLHHQDYSKAGFKIGFEFYF